MKRIWENRICLMIATLLMIAGWLPATAQAEENQNRFVFAVEAGGNLIVEPEYIFYTPGQTLEEALKESGHRLSISGGFVTEINGVYGNYTRSDQNGGHDLGVQAHNVTHFWFSERSSSESQPTTGLLHLMTAMAEYRQKEADVKRYAKTAFESAKDAYVNVSGPNAEVLALTLEERIQQYERIQSAEPKTVRFTDGAKAFRNAEGFYPGVTICVENHYGKVWMDDDGDGEMMLPADLYTYIISYNGLSVSGNLTVEQDTQVEAQMPEKQWLLLNQFRVSGSYDNYEYSSFSDQEFAVGQWQDRRVTVPVPDTYSGGIYAYVTYDKSLFENKNAPKMTAMYTMENSDQSSMNVSVPMGSTRKGVSAVLAQGNRGNTIVYRISSEWEGKTYTQDYTVNFVRIPSLSGITVKGIDEREKVTDQAPQEPFDPWPETNKPLVYKVLNSLKEVTITAEPYRDVYEIKVNGAAMQNGSVTLPVSEEDTIIQVEVSWEGQNHIYYLQIQPGEGKSLTIVTHKDVELEVVNENGVLLDYVATVENTSQSNPQKKYRYVLVDGVTYNYVATYNEFYHCTDTITLNNRSQIEIDFQGMENWMQELSFGMGNNAIDNKGSLNLNTSFQSGRHQYTAAPADTEHNVYIWLKTEDGVQATALYRQLDHNISNHGVEHAEVIPSGRSTGKKLDYLLMDENPIRNKLTIRLSKEIDHVLHYQDYEVDFNRKLTLAGLRTEVSGQEIVLQRPDGGQDFVSNQMEYDIKVSMAADTLTLFPVCHKENTSAEETQVGYRVKVNGIDATLTEQAEIPLNGTIESEVVTITVENDKEPDGTAVYIINVLKSPPVMTTFDYTPVNALLNIREIQSGERIWPDESGAYQLCEGYDYEYALTQYGYVSRSGILSVTQNEQMELVIEDGQTQYSVRGEENNGSALIAWELKTAPDSGIRNLPYHWPNFRGNDSNNAVTSDPIPYDAEKGTLYWASKLGSGFDADAVGSPILVDGDIITYAGNQIYRVDTVSGEIKKTGIMDHKSSFSITPPTYWNGMLFVALSDGCVQAFNAETLESLWLYRDPLGGQPNCPIVVKDGYLYTGFWKSEVSEARFVCLSVTDEDPGNDKESKCASWFYTAKGGFYWAGAYVGDGYVLVGTDDGTSLCTSQTSSMLLIDAKTGMVLDQWGNLDGDIRSTVVYDTQTNAHYFTSKGGTFYRVEVENGKLTRKQQVKLSNGSTSQPPMSTCSPVVYNGRAYVGVSGSSQFGQYSGHNITVIDLNSMAIAYSVPTQGYPQTSGLLTDVYGDGVYVYFFDNYTPGKLRVIYDTPNAGQPDRITLESYNDNGSNQTVQTAYALFTPQGEHAQYAICSPISDEYGTIYFKNDSAHLMAFGSGIESISVTELPEKTTYIIGEKFDPKGMQVMAHYVNGTSRDITNYVSYSDKPLEAAGENLTISFTIKFPHVLYHNKENGQEMNTDLTTTPTTTIKLTLSPGLLGDVNGDDKVDDQDANLILAQEAQNLKQDLIPIVADVSGDGLVDSDDAVLIFFYHEKRITQFPAETKSDQTQELSENGSGDPPQNTGS